MQDDIPNQAIQNIERIVAELRDGAKSVNIARAEIAGYLIEQRPVGMTKEQSTRFAGFVNSALRLVDSMELHPDELRSKSFDGGLEALRRQATRV